MFKKLIAYKYNSVETDFSKIHIQINNNEFRFKNLNKFDTHSCGFNCFYDDVFIIESDNRILLKITFVSKNVSTKTIEKLLDERIDQLKTENKTDEISESIRDIYYQQIERDCLIYTEPVIKNIYLLIDKYTNYIYVDSSSSDEAEDSLHLLRQLIGKLVCRQIESKTAPLDLSSFFSNPSDIKISESVHISDYPSISARDSDGVVVKLSGISRRENYFVEILRNLEIKSVDMELVGSIKTHKINQLALFTLSIGKRGIFIFKNFKYDEPDNTDSDDSISSDDSYYYTSRMLLVGRYMKLIIESFIDFFNLKNELEN